MYLPVVPAHVLRHGNNRDACLYHEDDYRYYLAVLADGLKRYRVSLHAYVLMTRHVQLLMTPTCETGISQVMQHVGRMYVLYINRTYRRTVTLWEGRHTFVLMTNHVHWLRTPGDEQGISRLIQAHMCDTKAEWLTALMGQTQSLWGIGK
jgi:putative transposase